jgi:type IV secretory pathway TrbF-like protein
VASVDYSPATNGQSPRSPELLAEFAILEKGYQELRARDGKAESRAFWWKAVALGLLMVNLGVGAWDHLDRRKEIEAFVQNVQVTEEGRVISLGIPQRVLEYTPEDSHWYGMLGQWVQKVRWRGPDPVLAKKDWEWAYLHSCGSATKLLREYERAEKPFEPSERRVSVELLGWNKTLVPLSYHIRWQEISVQPGRPIQRKVYNGIFTVGRVQLKEQNHLFMNPYGLCTTAYSISEEPAS